MKGSCWEVISISSVLPNHTDRHFASSLYTVFSISRKGRSHIPEDLSYGYSSPIIKCSVDSGKR